jgi:hypothetical protein
MTNQERVGVFANGSGAAGRARGRPAAAYISDRTIPTRIA